MDGCVTKPFTLASLSRAIAALGIARAAPISVVAPKPAPSERAVLNREVLDDIAAMQDDTCELVLRVIGLFRTHAVPALDRLAAAVPMGDGADIASLAHAMKSLCRNVGAERLGDRLHGIEEQARTNGEIPDEACLSALRDDLTAVLAALDSYTAKTVAAAPAAATAAQG
jgi:HPt (histidine-containing phosphotransfer) domain-containing protein